MKPQTKEWWMEQYGFIPDQSWRVKYTFDWRLFFFCIHIFIKLCSFLGCFIFGFITLDYLNGHTFVWGHVFDSVPNWCHWGLWLSFVYNLILSKWIELELKLRIK